MPDPFDILYGKKGTNYIVFQEKELPKIKLKSSKIDFIEIMDPRGIDLIEGLLCVSEGYRTSVEVPAIHLIETNIGCTTGQKVPRDRGFMN